jgi:hypothetical protein
MAWIITSLFLCLLGAIGGKLSYDGGSDAGFGFGVGLIFSAGAVAVAGLISTL